MRISWVILQRRLARRSVRDGRAGVPPVVEVGFTMKSRGDAIALHLSCPKRTLTHVLLFRIRIEGRTLKTHRETVLTKK